MKAIKNIRLKNYNYKSNGFYFVTIVAHQRQALFTDDNKNVVAQFIGRLNKIAGVSIDYSVVMPNHVHVIIILEDCDLKLGEVIRRLKAWTSHALGIKLWQPNYYEHIIRNEEALYKIREYIQNNPETEKIELGEIYGKLKSSTVPDKSGNYNG